MATRPPVSLQFEENQPSFVVNSTVEMEEKQVCLKRAPRFGRCEIPIFLIQPPGKVSALAAAHFFTAIVGAIWSKSRSTGFCAGAFQVCFPVIGSTHLKISEWPSAKAKLAPRL